MSEPATKADLQDLKEQIQGRMDVQEQRIIEQVGTLIRDSETRLLQAFYGYAEATNKRLNQVDGNVAIFLNRLGTVENRLLEVEKRLNIPPTA
jgi:hypothetical protein